MQSPPDRAEDSARYRRTLHAAEALFKRIGFRALTMERLAREANVAKATLYSYFRNKDEVYAAVCVRVAGMLQQAVDGALAREALALDMRLGEALLARQRLWFSLLHRSPYAEELFSVRHPVAGELFTRLDTTLLDHLEQALHADAGLAPSAATLAQALYFGSAALGARSETVSAMESSVSIFCRTHLAGARTLAGTGARPG